MSLVAVLDALDATCRAVWPERPCHYGPVPRNDHLSDEVATWLAHSETEEPAVAVTAGPAQEDGSQLLTVVVECAAAVYSGGSDVRVDLVTADEHVQAIRAAVNADRSLGGIAQNAEFGAAQNLFMGHDEGVRILVLFSVVVTVWSS